MVEQIRDALRHLEKDMADILDVMQDKETMEVILNPYRKRDGNYEGHILVEQYGAKLHNLIRYIETDCEKVSLSVGDTVLYKHISNHPDKILFWVKLTAIDTQEKYKANNSNNGRPINNVELLLRKQIAEKMPINPINKTIGLCIKSIFGENKIVQSTDSTILEFATDFEENYDLNDELWQQINFNLDTNDLREADYTNIVTMLNKTVPSTAAFTFAIKKIGYATELENFKPYPEKIVKSELVKMSATKAETIMSVLASITGKFIHNKSPRLECQIPKYGHRFTGVIPPAVSFPAFCIRKHGTKIYTLNDFVNQGTMEITSRDTIITWIKRKFNILIAGGTGSGKTTLANAILYEIAQIFPETRVLIIEDVPELQFNTSRSIAFNIGEFFSMYDALRTTLRFKPDRIVMGEVRGAEAYTLLKAWNTGHPGGIATIHANGVNEALYRFESCVRDHPEVKINRSEIGFTVNGIISIQNITLKEKENGEYVNVVKRRVTALRQILQYDPEKDIYQDIIYDKIEEHLDML